MKSNLFILITIALCTLFACKTNSNKSVEAPKPVELPAFTTVSMSDIPVYNFTELEPLLNQQNDTTYIVNFWATWCKPCIEELPYFEELNEYAYGKKMKVVLVSLDFKKQLETKLIPYLNEHKIRSEVVVLSDPDSNSWIGKVDENWSGAIPVTLIYNAKSNLFLEMTFEDFKQIKDIVEKFDRETSEL